jgi:hypothetical protein
VIQININYKNYCKSYFILACAFLGTATEKPTPDTKRFLQEITIYTTGANVAAKVSIRPAEPIDLPELQRAVLKELKSVHLGFSIEQLELLDSTGKIADGFVLPRDLSSLTLVINPHYGRIIADQIVSGEIKFEKRDGSIIWQSPQPLSSLPLNYRMTVLRTIMERYSEYICEIISDSISFGRGDICYELPIPIKFGKNEFPQKRRSKRYLITLPIQVTKM